MNKIYRWLLYPLKQKKASLYINLYKFFFSIIKIISKTRLIDNMLFSKIRYDLSDRENFFVTKTKENENFIVTGQDTVIGKSLYLNHEPHNFNTLEIAIKLLPKSFNYETIVDIGANIGTICIPSVKRKLFKKGIAIEPDPLNYSLLSANIALNQLETKIQSYNNALGSSNNKKLLFEISENNFGDNRISVNNNIGLFNEIDRRKIEVHSKKFDSLIKLKDPANCLLFIYTQGYEGHVLNGALNHLKQKPPLILLFCPYNLKRASCLDLLINILINSKYNYIYILNKSILHKIDLNKDNLVSMINELGYDGKFYDLLII